MLAGEIELSCAIVASHNPVCMDWNYWTPGVFHLLIIVYILTWLWKQQPVIFKYAFVQRSKPLMG